MGFDRCQQVPTGPKGCSVRSLIIVAILRHIPPRFSVILRPPGAHRRRATAVAHQLEPSH